MEQAINVSQLTRKWWLKKRVEYNKGLIVAGFIAFIAYCIVGEIFIAPHEEFEVTIFTTAFQGVGYLMLMVAANAFYSLGYVVDILFNKSNSDRFRANLYRVGYWFSFALPFSIPIILIIKFATK